MKKVKKAIETLVFASRWVLIGMIIRLFVVLIYIVVKACVRRHLGTDDIVWSLEAVDEAMVANLIKSIITGSYNSFISKDHGYKNENVSSGILKVKMGSSLVGISSIYLLKTFLELRQENIPWDELWKYLIIHLAFLLGTLVLAWVELLHNKSEYYDKKAESLETHSPTHTPNLRKVSQLY